jgi:hypothetical protein
MARSANPVDAEINVCFGFFIMAKIVPRETLNGRFVCSSKSPQAVHCIPWVGGAE